MKLQLTDRILNMVKKSDRKKLGLKPQEEIAAEGEVKTERDLHKAVANVLRLRGIEFFDSRMDRKTTRPKGEPDFLFSVWIESNYEHLSCVNACAWELKLPGRQLDPDQVKMFERMKAAPNSWQCCVVSSVDQALEELKRLGLP
jgi:hypothetical protein